MNGSESTQRLRRRLMRGASLTAVLLLYPGVQAKENCRDARSDETLAMTAQPSQTTIAPDKMTVELRSHTFFAGEEQGFNILALGRPLEKHYFLMQAQWAMLVKSPSEARETLGFNEAMGYYSEEMDYGNIVSLSDTDGQPHYPEINPTHVQTASFVQTASIWNETYIRQADTGWRLQSWSPLTRFNF